MRDKVVRYWCQKKGTPSIHFHDKINTFLELKFCIQHSDNWHISITKLWFCELKGRDRFSTYNFFVGGTFPSQNCDYLLILWAEIKVNYYLLQSHFHHKIITIWQKSNVISSNHITITKLTLFDENMDWNWGSTHIYSNHISTTKMYLF